MSYYKTWSIRISEDGRVEYKSRSGKEKSKTTFLPAHKKRFDSLINIVNYLNIKNAASTYEIFETHAEACYLTITFSDGSVKRIFDYGMKGTLGLTRVYQYFFDLQKEQDW